MRARIQRWGTSLALRIPRLFAQEVHVRKGSAVELSLKEGKIVMAPLTKTKQSLKKLLSKVTRQNIHHETDFGKALGQEVW